MVREILAESLALSALAVTSNSSVRKKLSYGVYVKLLPEKLTDP
jgi:hypothetical protein